MFFIKLLLILLWFVAGLLLFAVDVVVDMPFLKPIFEFLGVLPGTKKAVVKKVAVKPEPKKVTKPAAKPKAKPVVKPVVVEEAEEKEEENSLQNVQIFKKKITARTTWYAELTEAEKAEFRSYFVDDAPTHVVKELVYKLNGNNDTFFETVFQNIYAYRKVISFSLLEKLTTELLAFAEGDPEVQSVIYEAATRVAFYRRKDKAMLTYAEKLARLDVALQQSTLNAKNKYVYSFTRLAIILEKKGAFQEAIKLVDDALNRKLNDRTKTGYEGRKQRLQKRLTK